MCVYVEIASLIAFVYYLSFFLLQTPVLRSVSFVGNLSQLKIELDARLPHYLAE